MAAPTLQAEGTAAAVTTGAPVPTLPAHLADDILVCSAIYWGPNTAGDAAQIPIPAGWTLVGSQIGQPAGTRDGWLAWFWRRALGSSETITLTTGVGWDTGTDTCYGARVYVIRGADTTGTPWDAVAQVGPFTTPPNNFGAVTVLAAERMVVQFGNEQDNLGFTGSIGAWTSGVVSTANVGTGAGFKTFRQDNVATDSPATSSGGSPTPAQGAYAWTGISFKPPSAGTTVAAVTASATGSEPVPLPKLTPIPGPTSATASTALPVPKLSAVAPIAAASASAPSPLPKVIPTPTAASAAASAPTPTLVTTAVNIRQPPVASASASFPTPTKASSGITAVTPPANAAASLPVPALVVTLTAPVASATSSALSPLPRLTVLPLPAFATAQGVEPSLSATVIGVPVAGASAQALSPVPVIVPVSSAASATAMGVPPNLPITSGQFLARLPTHLRFAQNTTTLVLEGAELALALDG